MTTPPDPTTAPPVADASGTDARLARVEASLSTIAAQLHPAAQAHTEARLERPTTIAEQVDAALRQAQADQRAEAERADAKKFREDTTAAIKELRETKPGQAVTRGVERVMGWAK
jgi:D-alanyl-D-alanine dipeptidase